MRCVTLKGSLRYAFCAKAQKIAQKAQKSACAKTAITMQIRVQWKFYSLAIPKLGVILFVGKLNAGGEAPHLQHWGPILFLDFPRGFIPFFGVGESLKLAGFGQ